MTGCSAGRGNVTLNHGTTLVRLQPGQRCLFSDNRQHAASVRR